jgi:hypothetical protein
VIQKTAAIFVMFMMIIIPPNCSFASDKERHSGRGMKEFKLGELKLSVSEESEDGHYLMRFSKGKEVIYSGECAFKTQEPKTVANTPLPDCSTLVAYCFSGGAHCCTTLYIATQCGKAISLDMVDMAHSDMRVKFVEGDETPQKALKIFDWQFAYYAPEDSQIQLSFASSPAMTRLLVFDNGHWRPDRLGEFSGFYSRLFRQTVHEAGIRARKYEPESVAATAFKAAYYSIMSGESSEQAAEVLNRLLPAQWKPESHSIVKDINRAALEFNPVEEIR